MKPTSRVAKSVSAPRKTTKAVAPAASAKAGKVATAGLSQHLIDPVLAILGSRYRGADKALAGAFAQSFYQRLDADEFARHSSEHWAAMAADMFELVRTRKNAQVKVRVFNPDRSQVGWDSPHTVVQLLHTDMPYLVDTLTLALAEQGIGVQLLGHPVLVLGRDKAGKLTTVGSG